jgi:hypothetical protein
MYELVRIGNFELIGEIIRLEGACASADIACTAREAFGVRTSPHAAANPEPSFALCAHAAPCCTCRPLLSPLPGITAVIQCYEARAQRTHAPALCTAAGWRAR